MSTDNCSASFSRSPLEQLEAEKEEREAKLKKMEQEMEQVFEMKVKEKKKKLKDSEAEVRLFKCYQGGMTSKGEQQAVVLS